MYDDIVAHLPTKARKRVLIYAESVEEAHDTAELPEYYNVTGVRELVQHLAEYESGTAYPHDDKLIADYKLFWNVLGNVYGTEENAVDEIRSKNNGHKQVGG